MMVEIVPLNKAKDDARAKKAQEFINMLNKAMADIDTIEGIVIICVHTDRTVSNNISNQIETATAMGALQIASYNLYETRTVKCICDD